MIMIHYYMSHKLWQHFFRLEHEI